MKRSLLLLLPLLLACLLSACSIVSRPLARDKPSAPQGAQTSTRGGGYYKDDGPGDSIPGNLDAVPDAIPRAEPLYKAASRPYTVLGRSYTPQTRIQTFRQEGVASWYGKKFHGQKTSIGETYDMFAMTAAHPTLALPSYARVTNPANGRSVVVRVNDRGPFHAGRIMDLSYVAAYKLGYINNGSAKVIVESLVPGSALFDTLAAAPASSPVATFTPAPISAAVIVAAAPPTVPPPPDQESMDALALQLQAESDAPEFPPPPATGIFLQLGAFSLPENAENLKNHLLRELDWLTDRVFIHYADNLHRLQAGPYPTREAAQQIAARIHTALGYTPTIVVR
ncbi:MAG: septal ring lytic transglycosylase RlpA family protein [Zoogloeaceae bacterium]|jgi:rare lipoprotein A|nr:septal ring lytic transglycosylase RlpA family protein [Zoogloeaceae bacterium]